MDLATTAVRSSINALYRVSPRAAGRLAFAVWTRPMMRGKVRPAEAAVHTAARPGVLDVGGRQVTVYAWGDGRRPVLLVHGWRSRASRFAGYVPRLLELGYSPVSYDAFGHGDTPGPVGTVIDHERVIRALAERHGAFEGVIAHSMGVLMALHALRTGVAAKWFVSVSGVSEFGYLVEAFSTELRLHPGVAPALRRTIERRLFGGDDTIWTRFSATDPTGWPDAPLLVVHNDVDRVAAPVQSRLLAAAFGDRARHVETSGLGHNRTLTDPAVIDRALVFIAEAEAVAEKRSRTRDRHEQETAAG